MVKVLVAEMAIRNPTKANTRQSISEANTRKKRKIHQWD